MCYHVIASDEFNVANYHFLSMYDPNKEIDIEDCRKLKELLQASESTAETRAKLAEMAVVTDDGWVVFDSWVSKKRKIAVLVEGRDGFITCMHERRFLLKFKILISLVPIFVGVLSLIQF